MYNFFNHDILCKAAMSKSTILDQTETLQNFRQYVKTHASASMHKTSSFIRPIKSIFNNVAELTSRHH